MEVNERINLFLDMMSCSHDIYYWCFDKNLKLLSSTCKDDAVLKRVVFDKGADYLREYAKEHEMPLISSAVTGLVWASVIERKDGSFHRLHVLGPIYTSEISLQTIESVLNRYSMSLRYRRKLVQQFTNLPVLSAMRFFPYVKMLYFCVTGQKISANQFEYEKNAAVVQVKRVPDYSEEDFEEKEGEARHAGVYAAEQELFKMIEEGNINYAQALNNAMNKASYGSLKYQDPGQKSMAVAVTFIVLSVRAAIRGGLSPSIAYSVGDYYEEEVTKCKSFTDTKHVLDAMFDDFVHRVHKTKVNANISKPVQVCCDYIDMHIYEKIDLETLAGVVGYTKYYLTRKFKSELNISIWDYINQRKVERAKILLSDPSKTIQDISDMLNYCSRSYFSEIFQQHTGFWPSDYRAIELKM